MKRTAVSPSRADNNAVLKRSTWPTWSLRPRRAASSLSSAASRLVRVIGFSTSTCTPCSRKNFASAKCAVVLAAIVTASTRPASSR